jgi:hypothetical protein
MLALVMLQFAVFKLCFPFPDFISDSYNYILGAQLHLDVNIWPIGYSKFLALFHWFTTSAFALVLFQYGMYIFSVYPILYFHPHLFFPHPEDSPEECSRLFLFFNPLLLFLANYVGSDTLFASMSTIWLTQLIWIVRRPSVVPDIYPGRSFVHHVYLSVQCHDLSHPRRCGIPLFSPGTMEEGLGNSFGASTHPIFHCMVKFMPQKYMTGTASIPADSGRLAMGQQCLIYERVYKRGQHSLPQFPNGRIGWHGSTIFQPARSPGKLYRRVNGQLLHYPPGSPAETVPKAPFSADCLI